ncbi:MAG: type IV secretion system DNA-binding domain-containing protein [bacterium]|nr:type IV secretion system DNA-binding domain-containing protein [bacterium]
MALAEDIYESQIVKATRRFYEWEYGGRGIQSFDFHVLPEPPFVSFPGYYSTQPSIDDGRRKTFLSSVTDQVFGLLVSRRKNTASDAPEEAEPLDIESNRASYTLPHEIQITLPAASQVSKEVFEQFLLSLSYCAHPLVFEIIGLSDSITVQIVVSDGDLGQVRAQLSAHFPEASMSIRSDFFRNSWRGVKGDGETAIVDFGLAQEFMLPLATSRKLDPDPFIGIMGALSEMRDGEAAVFQVIFEPVCAPWAESILQAVICPDGTPFFMNAPDFAAQAKTKVEKPLYAAVVRIAARSTRMDRSREIVKALAGSLSVFSNPTGNELIPLEDDERYSLEDRENDLIARKSRRSGMILNSDELISIVHLPSDSVKTEKLNRRAKKTKAAPKTALNHNLVLGENVHLGETRMVTLNSNQRVRHTHVIGASGTGKSTLLLNLILQDIRNGEGIAVLDPHGDLVNTILEHIPEERFEDVIVLDPSDEEYAIGFNILSAHSELEKNLLASDLVAVFRRLSTAWGDQMTSVFSNAVIAFLESTRGGTLADLRRFLIEPSFRTEFLKTVTDPEVVYYWTRAYPLLSGRPQAPIITRLDAFLRPKPIRNMVSQKENRLNFAEIMNGGKILLARLSQGAIGEENAYLFGSLLVSKFHQLVMGRQETREEDRRDFWLYIDEFQNFSTPSMASILSGARKYRLGLTLAHQELRQLEARDPDVASAVLANACTRICFRLGDQDARKLENGFSFFKSDDMQSLGIGEAVCRIERADFDFNLTTALLPRVDKTIAEEKRRRIIALSREKYGIRRENLPIEPRMEFEVEKPSIVQPKKEEVRVLKEDIPSARESAPIHAIAERKRSPIPVQPGRGGREHKYLQFLIKKQADDLGYLSVIEKSILDGKGSVDVALQKGECSIACQICVTTPVDQEAANVKKCLSAGFQYVTVISADPRKLEQLRNAIALEVTEEDRERVCFFSPEQLLPFMQEIAMKSMSTEKTVKGYKLKTNYRPTDSAEIREQAIVRVVANSLKKLKELKK